MTKTVVRKQWTLRTFMSSQHLSNIVVVIKTNELRLLLLTLVSCFSFTPQTFYKKDPWRALKFHNCSIKTTPISSQFWHTESIHTLLNSAESIFYLVESHSFLNTCIQQLCTPSTSLQKISATRIVSGKVLRTAVRIGHRNSKNQIHIISR